MGSEELVFVRDEKICIYQATKRGYIEIDKNGAMVCDLSYPNSKTRRGRVQSKGNISPTLTATNNGIMVIEIMEL